MGAVWIALAVTMLIPGALARAQDAAAIACGQDGVLGEIDTLGEIDSFAFDGQEGGVVSISLGEETQDGPSFAPRFELLAPSGASLGSDTGRSQFTLTEAGTHTIEVSDLGADGTGTYSLSLVGASEASTCGAPIACGQDGVSGSVDLRAETDSYSFAAESGDAVVIGIGEESAAGVEFRPWFQLFAPSGASIVTTFVQTRLILGETGTHTLAIFDADQNGTGAYSLSLVGVSEGITCGGPIACGEGVAGSLDLRAESDSYQFAAEAGDVVAIAIGEESAAEGNFTPWYRLFAPSGANLLGAPFQNNVTLTETGAHTLHVFDANHNGTGSYSLSLIGASEAISCGVALACGEDGVGGSLDALGDMDSYQFPAQVGDVVAIAIGGETGTAGFDPWFELFAPSGMPLAATSGETDVALPESGSYTLKVFDSDHDGTGTYSLSLEGVSDSLSCGAPLDCGTAVVADGIDQNGDADAYQLDGSSGDQLRVTIEPTATTGGSFDPSLALFAPSGAAIGSSSSELQTTLTETGAHTVRIVDASQDGTGTYALSICGTVPVCLPDSDGDGLGDGCDPCRSFFNADVLDTSGDGVPDDCQCGDTESAGAGTNNGIVQSADAFAIASCVIDPAACAQDVTLSDTDDNGLLQSADAFGVAASVIDPTGSPAYRLRCARRPEGTPPP